MELESFLIFFLNRMKYRYTRKTSRGRRQKGGVQTITEEAIEHGIRYSLRNSLNSIKNKVRATHPFKTNARLSAEREFGFIQIFYEENNDLDALIPLVRSKDTELGTGPFAYIPIVTNNWDGSFTNRPNITTSVTEEEKDAIFGTANIGKIHPEKLRYFLKSGTGKALIDHAIEKCKARGIKTILLHAANKDLVSYYAKFGFKEISGVPMYESGEADGAVFGSGSTGPIMKLDIPA